MNGQGWVRSRSGIAFWDCGINEIKQAAFYVLLSLNNEQRIEKWSFVMLINNYVAMVLLRQDSIKIKFERSAFVIDFKC